MSAVDTWFKAIGAAEPPRQTEAPRVAAGGAPERQKKTDTAIVAPPASVRNSLPTTVPAPLANLPGWLVWRFVQKPGKAKPDKVPFYAGSREARGRHGAEQDREQLVGFTVARAAAEQHGFDGVGLAMLPEWGITALDFDDCIGLDGRVNARVLELCSGTYSETSPSGKGIRAFVAGSLGSHKDLERVDGFKFETFFGTGYVTFTGRAQPVVELLGYEDTHRPRQRRRACLLREAVRRVT